MPPSTFFQDYAYSKFSYLANILLTRPIRTSGYDALSGFQSASIYHGMLFHPLGFRIYIRFRYPVSISGSVKRIQYFLQRNKASCQLMCALHALNPPSTRILPSRGQPSGKCSHRPKTCDMHLSPTVGVYTFPLSGIRCANQVEQSTVQRRSYRQLHSTR